MKKSVLTIFFLFALHFSFSCPSTGLLLPIINAEACENGKTRTYIVHVQKPNATFFLRDVDRENWHKSFLPNLTLDSGQPRLIYSYRDVISGFAARLAPEEVKTMASVHGFLHAHPDELLPLLTTYTPNYLGLSQRDGLWFNGGLGRGVIIGMLDTGVDPQHPSFKDSGMPPPPRQWRGTCDFREPLCNNKLIGASAFQRGRATPVDIDDSGHGTHVASIAAGNYVDDVAICGNANGTSTGMAPRAHLAIYKVCSDDGCYDSDILAGIDQAIHDEVDVISISIGSRSRPFYEDSLAMGSFSAMRHRIPAVVAAGNDGPHKGTVCNDAPWIITVGASTTDRRIRATVLLGNGTELDGESAHRPSSLNSTVLPIVFPGYNGENGTQGCRNNSFDSINVKDKIVVCETGYDVSDIEKGEFVRRAGAAAMIILNNKEQGFTTRVETHVLPAVHLSFSDALKIQSYITESTNSTPTATIMFKGTQFGARPSPAVASFSSRGPSSINGGILKPDVIGPGVNIIAAWPSEKGHDCQLGSSASTFNFLSGTSMATPHLSGIVALLKNSHPHWSPAEIKSAIMTTADSLDSDGKPIADEHDGDVAGPYETGAGHLNSSAANDPGLLYELETHSYRRYLCGLGYTDEQVMAITQHQTKCSKTHHDISAEELNYPSISVTLGNPTRKTIKRRVQNVGEKSSVYFAEIEEPEGVKVEVSPYKLQFTKMYERRHFYVTLTTSSRKLSKSKVSGGQLSWVSNKHVVKTKIAVTFK